VNSLRIKMANVESLRKWRRRGWILQLTVLCISCVLCIVCIHVQNDSLLAGTQSLQRQFGLEHSVVNAPIGRLGPKGTSRKNLLYYDFLFLLSLKYGATSKRLLEVGCAGDPFSQYLNWMQERTCLAPYFVNYNKSERAHMLAGGTIKTIMADFMAWENPEHETYDLVVCNQVLEHVPDPKGFLQKLITTSQQATIVSVPYLWNDCGPKCGHLTHNITLEMVEEWAAPYKPVHHVVVTENNEKHVKRLFVVFQH
jgi:2-polyprenyl-3-methyl-5-hydroxy-6-metoxy-1,4-benzoquinol methylase